MKAIRYLILMFLALALMCTVSLAEEETITWAPVAWESISADEVILITMSKEGTTWVLTSDNGSTAAPSAATLSVSNNHITLSTVGTMGWKRASADGGYTFTAAEGGGMLFCNSANNGVRVGSGENTVFTVVDGYLKNTGTSRYLGVYNSQDWRCYTSINTNITGQTLTFWHEQDPDAPEDPAPTYSVTFSEAINGTAEVYEASETGYDAGSELHLNIVPDDGCRLTSLTYVQSGWTIVNTLTTEDIDETGMYCLTMPEGNITVTALFAPVNAWNSLQVEIDNSNDGDTLTLSENLTASAQDVPLVFPAEHELTLDLNGHTIDRALTSAQDSGSAIVVRGTLTITDSMGGGTITGGFTTGSGGGISMGSNAFLTFKGGTITGNTAKYGGGINLTDFADVTVDGGAISGNTATNHGGGVYLETNTFLTLASGSISGNTATRNGGGVYGGQYTTFDMTGGTISGNTSEKSPALHMLEKSAFSITGGSITGNKSTDSSSSGAVYVVIGGTFSISGSPRIAGNLNSTDNAGNVYLPTLFTLEVTGALTEDALISVSTADTPAIDAPVTITNGWNNQSEITCFASDNGWYVTEDEKEIKLFDGDPGSIYNVSIAGNIEHGTVTTDLNHARTGDTVTLSFAPEYGYRLSTLHVSRDGTDLAVENGQFIMPEGDVTVTASFASVLTDVSYIDENGAAKTIQAVPLTATDTAMPGGAYAVLEDLSLSQALSFNSDTLLILGDGAALSVTDPATAIGCTGTLTVFCQSAGTGELKPTVSNGFAIRCKNYVQYGGQVTVSGAASGVRTTENLSMHGGRLEATAGTCGLDARDSILITGGSVIAHADDEVGNGIYAKQNILITGGSVTATHDSSIAADIDTAAGMKADLGTLTMRADDTSDAFSVTATSYRYNVVLSDTFLASADGKAQCFLGADTPIPDPSVLDGCTLTPFDYGNPDFILPSNTQVIEENAFENTDVAFVYIPDSCQSIHDGAFKNCEKLKAVRLPASLEPFNGNPFEGCSDLMVFSSDESWLDAFCTDHGYSFIRLVE